MSEKQIQITRFDFGMGEEDRDLSNGYFKYLENMNAGEKARGLKQVADATAYAISGTPGGENDKRILKSIGLTNGNVYALGMDTSTYYGIWKWNGTTWVCNGATMIAYAGVFNPFFVYYQNYIWFAEGTYIGSYYTVDDTIIDKRISTVALKGGVEWQGKLYGWNGTDLYEVDPAGGGGGGTSTVVGPPIPADQSIVDLIPYGNLMCILTTGIVRSKMYIWDGVTTTTFYDIVDMGVGTVVGGCLQDGLITVIINTLSGKSFRIREYNGAVFNTVAKYGGRKNTSGTINTYVISRTKQSGGFIYFLGSATRGGSTDTKANVLFRYGKNLAGERNSLCVYKNLNFASATLTGLTQTLNDFIILDDANTSPDYVSVFATLQDTTTPTIKEVKTDGTYNDDEGVIETAIFTGGDSSIEKQLSEMSIQCAPLTAGQSIKLSYKSDADTSWIEIITIDTVGTISYEPVLEADGSNLKTSKEVAFCFELLGGAELTGFTANYQPLIGQR